MIKQMYYFFIKQKGLDKIVLINKQTETKDLKQLTRTICTDKHS